MMLAASVNRVALFNCPSLWLLGLVNKVSKEVNCNPLGWVLTGLRTRKRLGPIVVVISSQVFICSHQRRDG